MNYAYEFRNKILKQIMLFSYNGKEEMTGPPLEGTRCGHDGSR